MPDALWLVPTPKQNSRRGYPLCPGLCECTNPLLIDEAERCLRCGKTTRTGHWADCPSCRSEDG